MPFWNTCSPSFMTFRIRERNKTWTCWNIWLWKTSFCAYECIYSLIIDQWGIDCGWECVKNKIEKKVLGIPVFNYHKPGDILVKPLQICSHSTINLGTQATKLSKILFLWPDSKKKLSQILEDLFRMEVCPKRQSKSIMVNNIEHFVFTHSWWFG